MNELTLSDIIKKSEKNHEMKVNYDDIMIVRIDGHKFSKFTKKFKKPFDMILSKSMENTSIDLIEKFGAVTGFTQSDEITLIFPPFFKDDGGVIINNQIFGGRTQKVASLIASYTSIRFNYWLNTEYENLLLTDNDDAYKELLKSRIGTAWFDARVFGVHTKEDAFNVIKWRAIDAITNSKSMFAQAYCSHKALLKKSNNDQIAFCLETTNNDWNLVDERFKYGILLKKEKYLKEVDIMHELQTDTIIERTRIISFSDPSFCFNNENIDVVNNKFI